MISKSKEGEMQYFQSWFDDRHVYLLPDGTPVLARYCELNDRPRWWFVEVAQDEQLGQILAVVLPDGNVWNYVPGPDQAVRLPQRSDLSIEDLRPGAPRPSVRDWAARTGQILALLWAIDGVADLIGAATTLAA
jgi:hypothetical protein